MTKLFKPFQRTNVAEMRPYVVGENMQNISVADADTPEIGGYVARNPQNHKDKWYVSKEYFNANFAPYKERDQGIAGPVEKTLQNSDTSKAKVNVPDIKVFGDGDLFQLISKASSENEGWMKSTKAMQIGTMGCLVQVTTQQRNPDGSYSVAEALTYVPGARVIDNGAHGRSLGMY